MTTTPLKFACAVDECDVHDRSSLERYRALLVQIHEWLCVDQHCVDHQLFHAATLDMTFHCLCREVARHAHESKTRSAALNPLLYRLISVGHATILTTKIRSLAATNPPAKKKGSPKKAKGIISIVRILDHLIEHASLLTRENIVAYNGGVYDLAKAKQRRDHEYARLLSEARTGVEGDSSVLASKNYYDCKCRHLAAARWIGSRRGSRTDRVPEDRLQKCRDRIHRSVLDIAEYTNKFVAHQADADSRATLTDKQKAIKYPELASAIKTLFRARNEISWTLWEASMKTPIAHYLDSAYEHLEHPWLGEGAFDLVQQCVDRYSKSFEAK